MSDWNSPPPPSPHSDSSMDPRYSDETIRGRPSPLDIDETRRRLSFGDSDSEEDRSLNSAMNAVLTNAAHLRPSQQEHNSPDSMFADESDADFRSPVSVEEMRNNARSPHMTVCGQDLQVHLILQKIGLYASEHPAYQQHQKVLRLSVDHRGVFYAKTQWVKNRRQCRD